MKRGRRGRNLEDPDVLLSFGSAGRPDAEVIRWAGRSYLVRSALDVVLYWTGLYVQYVLNKQMPRL